MAIRIGSNIASLSAQRRLNEATTKTSTAFERLASGQRLNRPSDDPAGLAVASALRVSSRVFTQATRNINDGISYLSIAEGALTELKGIIIRARELATQASNGTFSTTQRASLDNELQALGQEYNRIIDTTSFNGTSIFDSSNENLTLQAGFGTAGILTAAIGSDRADAMVASRNASVTADGT